VGTLKRPGDGGGGRRKARRQEGGNDGSGKVKIHMDSGRHAATMREKGISTRPEVQLRLSSGLWGAI